MKSANPDYNLAMRIFALRPFFTLSIVPVAICTTIIALIGNFYYSADLLIQVILATATIIFLDGGLEILNIALDESEDKAQGKLTALTIGYLSKRSAFIITTVMWGAAFILSLVFGNSFTPLWTVLTIIIGILYQDSFFLKRIIGLRAKDHYLLCPLSNWIGYGFLTLSMLSFFASLTLKGIIFAVLVGCLHWALTIFKDMREVRGDTVVGKSSVFSKFGLKKGYKIFQLSLFLPILIGICAFFYDGISILPLLLLVITMVLSIILSIKHPRALILMLRYGIVTIVGFGYLIETILISHSLFVFKFALITFVICSLISLILYFSLFNLGYQNFENLTTYWQNFLGFRHFLNFREYFESLIFRESSFIFTKLQSLADLHEMKLEDYVKAFEERLLQCTEIYQKPLSSIVQLELLRGYINQSKSNHDISLIENQQSCAIGEYLANWASPDYIYRKRAIHHALKDEKIENLVSSNLIVDIGGLDVEISLELHHLGFKVLAYKENPFVIKLGEKMAIGHSNYQIQALNFEIFDNFEPHSVRIVLLVDPFDNNLSFDVLLNQSIGILEPGGLLLIVTEPHYIDSENQRFNSFEELKSIIQKNKNLEQISGFEHDEARWISLEFVRKSRYIYLMAIKGIVG